MNQVDFGKLVAALRKEIRDEEDRSWSQRKLGEETGLGEIVVSKIERGQRVNMDGDTLCRLARALQLSSGERREFFLASADINQSDMAHEDSHPEDVLMEMVRVLETARFPAFVVDCYGDFVAATTSMLLLFEVPSEAVASSFAEPAGFNMMRVIFAPDFRQFRGALGEQWVQTATYNMEFFRCITLRYRFNDYFIKTFSQLRTYPLFRKFWHQCHLARKDYCLYSERYKYEHPKHGRIDYFANVSVGFTSYGELYLVVYLPADTRTAEMLASLGEQGGSAVLRLAPWPDKEAPARF